MNAHFATICATWSNRRRPVLGTPLPTRLAFDRVVHGIPSILPPLITFKLPIALLKLVEGVHHHHECLQSDQYRRVGLCVSTFTPSPLGHGLDSR
jgi:hypothetical protein